MKISFDVRFSPRQLREALLPWAQKHINPIVVIERVDIYDITMQVSIGSDPETLEEVVE